MPFKYNSMFHAVRKALLQPSLAWLYLFVPALSYFVSTRLHSMGLFRSSTYGDVIEHRVEVIRGECSTLQKKSRNNHFLYLLSTNKECQSLQYPLYQVLRDDTESIVSTTWKDDKELGRGYLLISSQANTGKIYRWETGGGPIAIGRTLHLQHSGCRSNLHHNCLPTKDTFSNFGSGGIVVDATMSTPDVQEPRLIVGEYGEGRVTRLEENGARTPLVIQVPYYTENSNGNDEQQQRRLCEPFRLLITPHQDLMILERTSRCGRDSGIPEYMLWRVPKASDIPGLPSLAASRRAHEWTQISSNATVPIGFFVSSAMGGMAMDTTGHRLLVTMQDRDTHQVLVVSLSLSQDDGSEEEASTTQHSTLVLDYSTHAQRPGAIATDNHGNLYLAVDNGVLVVSKLQDSMVKIRFSIEEPIVDLTVGGDKFLYLATSRTLLRFRIPSLPLVVDKDTLRKNQVNAI
jgi:hypothetical protein